MVFGPLVVGSLTSNKWKSPKNAITLNTVHLCGSPRNKHGSRLLVLRLPWLDAVLLGNQLQKGSVLLHFLHDVDAANKFALDVKLRIRRPIAVLFKTLSHLVSVRSSSKTFRVNSDGITFYTLSLILILEHLGQAEHFPRKWPGSLHCSCTPALIATAQGPLPRVAWTTAEGFEVMAHPFNIEPKHAKTSP